MMLLIITGLLIIFLFTGCSPGNEEYFLDANIVFADSCTKEICLIWDLDNNGEISSQEVSLVNPTTLKNLFQGELIHSFNELKYFSGLNQIPPNCFFYNTSLKSITLPTSVKSIGSCSFSGCSDLSYINIPSSVTSIGMYCFSGCISLISISLPNSITILENGCFYECVNLESIKIPNSVTSIEGCFRGCSSLRKVILPSSLINLGMYSFSRCSGLESITIPKSVESIGQYCFDDCKNLKRVNFAGSNPPELDFESLIFAIDTLCVPKGAKEIYINRWKIDHDVIIIESNTLM